MPRKFVCVLVVFFGFYRVFCRVCCVQLCQSVIMASSSDSSSEFGDLINEMVLERDAGMGIDNQSDISVSSVHTSGLPICLCVVV